MRTRALVLVALIVAAAVPQSGSAQWWRNECSYRLKVTVDPNGAVRYEKPVEVENLNFTNLLTSLGVGGAFDARSLRAVEVNSVGALVDSTVVFQFDRDPGYDSVSNAAGTVLFLMKGTTQTGVPRYFQLYFDVAGKSFTAPAFTSLVSISGEVSYAGELSYRIESQNARYYYQKQGASFAAILDSDRKEWVGFDNINSGLEEDSRGIPNMVYDPPRPGYFHPGFTSADSKIDYLGPLRIRIHSTSNTGNPWECVWDIFPDYARMTLLVKGSSNFWFLYEGTPGGSFERSTDYNVRSTGVRQTDDIKWTEVLPDPSWVYFGDESMKRVLFAAHHNPDNLKDTYWPLTAPGQMTVFGFGREDAPGPISYFTAAPQRFTIGFAEDSAFTAASRVITSAYKDLTVSVGAPEVGGSGYGLRFLDPVLGDTTSYSVRVQMRSATGPVRIGSSSLAFAYPSWLTNPVLSQRYRYSGDLYDIMSLSVPSPGNALLSINYLGDPSFGTLQDTSFVDVAAIDFTVKGVAGSGNLAWKADSTVVRWDNNTTPVGSGALDDLIPPVGTQLGSLSAAAESPTAVRVSWTTMRETRNLGFEVQRSPNGTTDFVTLAGSSVAGNGTVTGVHPYSFVDTTVAGGPWYYRLHQIDSGSVTVRTSGAVKATGTVGVENEGTQAGLPEGYRLEQNYPNPFNPTTVIAYALPAAGDVRLVVCDVLGREVAVLVNGREAAGRHSVRFAAQDLASGVYVYRLTTAAGSLQQKMMLMK